MRARYTCDSGGGVALGAATVAKTIFGVLGDTGFGVDLLSWGFSFDGLDAAQSPVKVELCYCTWATNNPGTASTTVTPVQVAGRAVPESFSAGKNWTSEPTTLTVLKTILLDPNKGMYEKELSLGAEYDSDAADGFAVRMTLVTAATAVNSSVWMEVARV